MDSQNMRILPCFKPLSLVFGLFLPTVSMIAFADEYIAPVDQSKWTATGDKIACQLSHEIPGYGEAVFEQDAGKRLTFTLEANVNRISPTNVKIIERTASWKAKSEKPRKILAELKAEPGKYPVTLDKMTPYQMLSGLANGHDTSLIFQASNDTVIPPEPKKAGKNEKNEKKDKQEKQAKTKVSEKIKQPSQPKHQGPTEKDIVVLSSMGFQKPYQSYLACVNNLVRYNFEEIKKDMYFFDSGSRGLTSEVKIKLDALAQFIMHDKNVYRVDLTGHSDSVGGYMANRKLSYERMWLVKDYLVFQGVNPELFTMKAYGDRMPIGKNKTKEGRAKNRRVEIKVFR